MNWRLIGKAFRNGDMRRKILIVLGMIIVFRFLSHIPIPLAEPTQLKQLLDTLINQQQFLGFLNYLSGGALSNFSIMLLGIGPYITVSIVMQMMTQVIPSMKALSKEGEAGQRKITQWTRILTFPFAILQSIATLFLVKQQATATGGITLDPSLGQWILMIAALTGGAMLLMWLGELISEQGVGNGISLLVFVGIVSQLPSTAALLVSTISGGGSASFGLFGLKVPLSLAGITFALLLIAMTILVTYWVVKLNEAKRIIDVNYAKRVRGSRAYGGINTELPIKLITAGIVPVIFATATLTMPQFLGAIMVNADTPWLVNLGQNLQTIFSTTSFITQQGTFSTEWTSYIYPVVYFMLIMVFTYFYTSIVFNAKEISEELQKQGGFIAGIRPGQQTESYLNKVVNRLTFFGAVSIGLLAMLPFILDAFVLLVYKSPLSRQLSLGGTGILIVVSVALETLRQIESKALMVTYDQDD